jgi:putative ABC transport system permease protein
LALRSLGRSRGLTVLMIIAVALGIGACMTTYTVLRITSADPLPGRSATVLMPRVDPRSLDRVTSGSPLPTQLTWADGQALMHARRARRQALMTGGTAGIQPEGASPFMVSARYTTADFFAMFGAPFADGTGWGPADDDSRARVAVLSASLAQRLFPGGDAIGKTVRVNGSGFRVVGVLAPWRLTPHFYDVQVGSFSDAEDLYVPLATARAAQLPRSGGVECWGRGSGDESAMETADCVWLQFWVQLDDATQRQHYLAFLDGYVREQVARGRFARYRPPALTKVIDFLREEEVVPRDQWLQFWLSLGFLFVCLVNTVALMLAKFMRRSAEFSVRRALGASRRQLFGHLLTEAAVIGVAGGVGGLLCAWLGLALVRMWPDDFAPLARMDGTLLAMTCVLSVLVTTLAGWVPAWRACRVPPGLQLKAT